jgi:hypothetical protein
MARDSSGDKTKAQKTTSRKPPPAAKPAKKPAADAPKPAAKPVPASEPRLSVAAALLRKNARRIGA